MSTETVEIVVVGNGMFGSAAIRHLAQRGHQVVGIGPAPQGSDAQGLGGPGATESRWPSHQVYSSHNDAARLTRRHDRNKAWAKVTKEAISNYRRLERESGITFFHDVGCLIVSRPGGDGINNDPLVVMDEIDLEYTLHQPGETSWRDQWPALSLPETHYVAHEASPAGYLQPKRLIAAQNTLAEHAGARLIADIVVEVVPSGSGFKVQTAGGLEFVAGQVLIAAGAFSNFNDLLPSPVDMTLKSEVVVLGEVTDDDAAQLGRYPTMKYLIDPGDLEGIYMVPPVRYDDGRCYVKMGANTRLDTQMTELAQLQRWFNTDTDSEYLPMFEPVLRSLWPGVDFVSMRTQPCVITRTSNSFPIIERVSNGVFVATAGNGGGAKGSDAWGARAADLMET